MPRAYNQNELADDRLIEDEIRATRKGTKIASRQTKKLAVTSRALALETTAKLDDQIERVQSIHANILDQKDALKTHNKIMNDMNRCWLCRLCCHAPDAKFTPVGPTWDFQDDEERRRVEGMVKAEKRIQRRKREMVRAGRARDDVNHRGEEELESDSSRSANDQADDDEYISKEERLKVKMHERRNKWNDAAKFDDDVSSCRSSTFSADLDNDLDCIADSLQDIKGAALRIQNQGDIQAKQFEILASQVDKNQDRLESNNAKASKSKKHRKEIERMNNLPASLTHKDKLVLQGMKKMANVTV